MESINPYDSTVLSDDRIPDPVVDRLDRIKGMAARLSKLYDFLEERHRLGTFLKVLDYLEKV